MLVLSRKVGEKLVIGDNITVVVNRVAGNRVTIGIEAPNSVRVIRGELKSAVDQFRQHPEAADSPQPFRLEAESDARLESVPRLAK